MFRLIVAFLILSFSTIFPAAALQDGPAIWRVSDDDTDIHIFGSIHVLKPGTVWLSDELQALISNADAIYLEISAEQQSPAVMQPLVQKYGMLAEGDALKNHLPEALYQSLVDELAAIGMPEKTITRFQPWMAGTIYSFLKFAKLGFNPAAGVEAALVSLAQAQGKAIDGLETAEFQMALFDGLTDEQQLEFVAQTLKDKDQLGQMMEDITTAWTSGDLEALEAVFTESFEGYAYLKERFLTSRNHDWVTRMEEILEKPGNFLVAVGTGHLVGEQSLIALMEEAGLSVTRIH